MRDEGLSLAYGVLNVARAADVETIEAAFARRYKAARRQAAGGDRRRQELNAALETLTHADRRAAEEVESFWVPLDREQALPSPETLAAELLPIALEPRESCAEQVLLPSPPELAAQAVAALEPAPPVTGAQMLTSLAARWALEQLDPWGEGSAR